MPSLPTLRVLIAQELDKIAQILGPDYKMSCLARHKSNDQAHILVSEDDETDIITAVTNLRDDPEASINGMKKPSV